MSYGFLMDLNRCTGCGACVIACAMENDKVPVAGNNPGPNWRDILTFNPMRHPKLPLFNLSLSCNHCAEPACLKNCPAMAYKKDPETGAVIHFKQLCIGCKYCTWACPYDAPKYNAESGVVEKCTFCRERIVQGLEPACVTACPVDALRFEERVEGKIDDRMRIPGFMPTPLEPAIAFVSPRGERHLPEATALASDEALDAVFESTNHRPARKITLRSEWALLLFTTIAAFMSALFFAFSLGKLELHPALFGGLGAIAMGVTFVHLGQKRRAFRAVFHVRRSWLSREILFFSLFLGLGVLSIAFFPGKRMIGIAVNILGLLSLISIDLIYRVTETEDRPVFHSGRTVLNGSYLAAILTGIPAVAAAVALLKLFLYVRRRYHILPWPRVAVGLILPTAMLIAAADRGRFVVWFAAAAAVVGDLLDRIEFYREMDVTSPRKQIVKDLNFLLHKKSPRAIMDPEDDKRP